MRDPISGKPKTNAPSESPKKPTSRPKEPKKTPRTTTTPRYHTGTGGRDYVAPSTYTQGKKSTIPQSQTMWIAARQVNGKKVPGYLAHRSGPKKGQRVTGDVRIEKPGTTYPSKTVQSGPGGTKHRQSYTTASYAGGRNTSPLAAAARDKAKSQRVEKKLDSKANIAKGRARAVKAVKKRGK